MRDKSHMDHVERWAKYVRSNPAWRSYHTKFINAQFENAYDAIDRILMTKNGKKKIQKMYNIQNLKGYPKIFG